jgi:tetratricopeptide (TPR) repeat protein
MAVVAASCAKKPVATPTAPGAPHYPDFIFPAAQATNEVAVSHQAAWATLQAGDPRGAERQYAALLKRVPDFYPAEAGLGYAALARRDWGSAVSHFDKAIAANPSYAPALAGKGDALLAMGRTAPALEAFEAALAVDASLTAIRSRVDVLKFRGAQQNIEAARKAAEAGRVDDARRDRRVAAERIPVSRAGRRRSEGGGQRRGVVARGAGGVTRPR